MACVVVFCTTYLMILPAITMESEAYCGLEEHTHTEACYAQTDAQETTGEASAVHVHTEICYTQELQLVCTIPVEEHEHTEECTHTSLELTCSLEESEGHTHNEDCYTTGEILTCTLVEAEAHTHDEGCLRQNATLVCGQEESESHIHTKDCYVYETVLICGLPESEGHAHTEACWTQGTVLSCGQTEQEAHTHTDACYTETVTYTCEPAHVHTEACYQEESVLVCKELETAESEETAQPQQETDAQEQAGSEENRELICGYEEHTHDLACYSNPDADVETAEVWERTLPQTLSDSWPDNLLAVAVSQLGYAESTQNYIVTEDDQLQGYTRYGAWYGEPYSDWNAIFLSFCLNYAQVPQGLIAPSASSAGLVEQFKDLGLFLTADETPYPGDIICLDTNGDGVADRVGIVRTAGDSIQVIEGDSAGAVRTVTYSAESTAILGYGVLPTYTPAALPEEPEVDAADGDEDQTVTDPYNLGNYITAVTVQHKAPGEVIWKDVEDGNVQTGDALRFDIQYTIPGKTLDADNRTVTYDLPSSIKAAKAETGYVYNGSQVVGTYTITTDGKITITFTEDYAKSNADGSEINGHIAFESSVSDIDTNTKGDVTIPFKQDITLHVTDKENNTADLQVTKAAANVNKTAGTVDYTLTVTSENGTGGPVTLTDVMTNVVRNGDITVKDKAGNTVAYSITQDENGKFVISLPEMDAGAAYTITYPAKLTNAETLNGTITASNTVDVESTDDEGGKLVDEDKVDTTFQRDILSKSGTLNGDTVTWTIVVNESKVDIGGWVLSDTLNGSAFTGEVAISPSINGASKITLPYTFPDDSTDTYTITYTQTIDSTGELGSTTSTNTAALTPPGSPAISDGDTVTTGSYNPLDKSAAGVVLNGVEGEDKLAEYRWNVTIDASQGDIVPYTQTISGQSYTVWYYGDELWNEATHWITGAQLKAMAANLAENYDGRFEIIAYVWTGTGNKWNTPTPLSQVSDTAKYGQFRILFYDTLEQGEKITFTYSSTGNVGSAASAKELTNWGTVNNKTSDQVSQTYRPVVTKVDKNGSGSVTQHDIDDSKLTFKDGQYTGVLGWNVNITLPNTEYTQDVIITEDIPDGTELLAKASGQWSLSFYLQNFSNEDFNFNGGDEASITKTVNGTSYTVTAKRVNGSYVVTVPAALANLYRGQTISMEVRVQIDDDFDWDQATKSFVNTVTVTTGDSQLGEATQTQQIRNPAISKSSAYTSGNIIPYSLEINPDGRDLVAGADTLNLTDILSYRKPDSGTVNASLLLDTVKVYVVDASGGKTDITAQCPFTVVETEIDWLVSHTLNMTVPDGKRLLVEYSYQITGEKNTSITVTNSASILQGSSESVDSEDHQTLVTIQDSSAGATLQGISLEKVDASNFALKLSGAEFTLEKWDGTAYVSTGEVFTSDTSGTVSLNELKDDVAYRLVETKAPTGYMVDSSGYEFYLKGENASPSLPSDFSGKALNDGDKIIFTNSKLYYELPSTGGPGAWGYTWGGLLMLSLGVAYLYFLKKKSKKVGA